MPDSSATQTTIQTVDLSTNERLPVIAALVHDLSRAVEPDDVMRIFAKRFRDLGDVQGYVSLSVRGMQPGEFKITRYMLDLTEGPGDADGALERALQNSPWENWSKMPAHRGGILGELISTPEPKLVTNLQIEDDPVLGSALKPFGSLIALPLFDNGEALNWSISLHHDPGVFTPTTVEELLLRSNLAGGTVRQLLAAKELRAANKRIRDEMELIAKIQRSLLPMKLPTVPFLHMAASYQTYDSAGGDLYDIVPVGARNPRSAEAGEGDGRWAFLIADASGHGPAAATVIAMLSAIFRAYPGTPRGPAEVLAYLNEHLYAKRIESTFVTAFLAFFDPSDLTLTYARAGHPPPILKDMTTPDGKVQRLDEVGSFPLGIVDEATYEQATVQLLDRQTLLLYTDGITEAMDPAEEFFGVEGVETAMRNCIGDPDCTVMTVQNALRKHEAGIRPGDDQTLLAIQVARPK